VEGKKLTQTDLARTPKPVPKKTAKSGRPPIGREARVRTHISLTEAVDRQLNALGDDSLSDGIEWAANAAWRLTRGGRKQLADDAHTSE
jgi:hypothetical protein